MPRRLETFFSPVICSFRQVGGGSERRADTKDAKKLRRKKKTETEKEAGRRVGAHARYSHRAIQM